MGFFNRCVICGDKAEDSYDIRKEASLRDLKNKRVYTSNWPYVLLCAQCVRIINGLYFYNKFSVEQIKLMCKGKYSEEEIESGYNDLIVRLDRRKNEIYLDNEKMRIWSKNYYEIAKKKMVVNELNQKIYSELESRQEIIQNKYPQFIFPNLKKHNHVCATRHNDNLILVENMYPNISLNLEDEKLLKTGVEELLSTLSDEEMFTMSVIPIENIVSYQLVGNVEHVALTSGGGGGGGQPNLRGAAVGGLLFGGAGAIIGAQTGIHIDPIMSTVKEYDSRRTIFNLKNIEGQVEIKELPYYYSEVFMKVIPEKEFNFLQANKNSETPTHIQNTPALNMVEEMKQLKELLELELITQEEYDSKRQQILKL